MRRLIAALEQLRARLLVAVMLLETGDREAAKAELAEASDAFEAALKETREA